MVTSQASTCRLAVAGQSATTHADRWKRKKWKDVGRRSVARGLPDHRRRKGEGGDVATALAAGQPPLAADLEIREVRVSGEQIGLGRRLGCGRLRASAWQLLTWGL